MAESEFYYHTTTQGSRIFVEKSGSGPLMVMMHGIGGTTNTFQPLISHFSSTYTILRFEFPGSGFSTFVTPPTIPSFVEDLASILATQKRDEKPILVGNSLGSIIAMHYASLNPQSVKGLVLIGPSRSAIHIPAAVERMTGLASKARQGIEALRDSTVSNNVSKSSSDLVRTIVRLMISVQNPEGYAATWEAVCGKDHVDPAYSAINCPSLVIAGDDDNIAPLQRSNDIAELIGKGKEKRRVEVKVVHSGHQHTLEDTNGVVEAIKGFIVTL